MTANDGDNATSPKDSAWPGLYTEDAGIRRRSPQARDPSWRQGSQSSQAGALIDYKGQKGQKAVEGFWYCNVTVIWTLTHKLTQIRQNQQIK